MEQFYQVSPFHDQAALRAALGEGVALCTIIGIEGSFSRRMGAQLAVGPAGVIAGSLSDGCLENELANEVAIARQEGGARVMRYGQGSAKIDFRLPCGSGLDILIDPEPDRDACRRVVAELDARRPAVLVLPVPDDAPAGFLRERPFVPVMRLMIFGEGPEMTALAELANAMGVLAEIHARQGEDGGTLALGQRPDGLIADGDTAIVLLFHDHEWEAAILEWALGIPAFYIGAQGGKAAREARADLLLSRGCDADTIARVRSPVGLIGQARDPSVLALSVLAEIVAVHEAQHPCC